MMNLLIAEDIARDLNKFQRHTAVWRVEIDSSNQDYESLILIWLEEILYKLEIDNRFYVDGQYMIRENKPKLICEVQVSYIDANLVERNLEIKAVTHLMNH